MRHILATTAIVLATATAASAQDREQLVGAIQAGIESMGMQIDYSALSIDQLAEIQTALSGSGMESQKEAQVQQIATEANALEGEMSDGGETMSEDEGAMTEDDGAMSGETAATDMSRSQLESQVENFLSGMASVDAEASELSQEELAQIYSVLNSGMDEADQEQEVQTILREN